MAQLEQQEKDLQMYSKQNAKIEYESQKQQQSDLRESKYVKDLQQIEQILKELPTSSLK